MKHISPEEAASVKGNDKSVNLQYNTMGRLDDGTNESLIKRLMFQVLFFSWFLAKFFAKILSIYFLIFFYKIRKIKSFECPKSIKIIKRNNTWNVILLVDNSFVPSSKQPSVIYCRLTDLMTEMADWRQSLPFSILSKL